MERCLYSMAIVIVFLGCVREIENDVEKSKGV